jgi:hypothetical protein
MQGSGIMPAHEVRWSAMAPGAKTVAMYWVGGRPAGHVAEDRALGTGLAGDCDPLTAAFAEELELAGDGG